MPWACLGSTQRVRGAWGGLSTGWGQGGGPPSFLPSLVICSEPGMDGARGPLTCSTLGVSAPRCCWTWSQGEHIVSYHRFWAPAPALHLRTVLFSSWWLSIRALSFLNFKRRIWDWVIMTYKVCSVRMKIMTVTMSQSVFSSWMLSCWNNDTDEKGSIKSGIMQKCWRVPERMRA